jgi:hypothetical protein
LDGYNTLNASLNFEALYVGQVFDMASFLSVQDGQMKQKYANLKLTKAKADNYKAKLFDSKFPIPTAPGLQAVVTFYLFITAEGQISVTAEYTQSNRIGIEWSDGEFKGINKHSSDFAMCGAADASIYGGVGMDVGVTFLGLATAAVAPEIGIQISASTEFDESLFDNTATRTVTAIHDCILCVDGDINLKLGLRATVDVFLIGNLYNDELISFTNKLGDFYVSFGGTTHEADFDWGECPYTNTTSSTEPTASTDYSGLYGILKKAIDDYGMISSNDPGMVDMRDKVVYAGLIDFDGNGSQELLYARFLDGETTGIEAYVYGGSGSNVNLLGTFYRKI